MVRMMAPAKTRGEKSAGKPTVEKPASIKPAEKPAAKGIETFGILVIKALEGHQIKVLGSYPPNFVCPPKLLESIGTNLDYGSFRPWGDVSIDAGIALCKLETTEFGKEYLICLVCDETVDLRSASEFLNLIASKLALAENLGKLEENLPRLAPLVLENLTLMEAPVKKTASTPPPAKDQLQKEKPLICPFRMSLPEGQQECIREKCMSYFGDIGKAILLLQQLFSTLAQGGDKTKLPFEDLNKALPKEGCFLIHGKTPCRKASKYQTRRKTGCQGN